LASEIAGFPQRTAPYGDCSHRQVPGAGTITFPEA